MLKVNNENAKIIIPSKVISGRHQTIRMCIVIGDWAFYCSSGKNSGLNAKGTFFPMLGFNDIIEKPCHVLHEAQQRGTKAKNRWDKELSKNISETESQILAMKSELKDYYETFTYKILKRFNSWSSMLISSVLGGGIWNSDDGKKVKSYLITSVRHKHS
jgi:hypothetical protein